MVYFAKAPRPGLVKTRLCPPLLPKEAAALYGSFLQECVQPVPGARTLVYGWPAEPEELAFLAQYLPKGMTLRPQQGADLWQRMQHCLQECFAERSDPEGSDPVVIRNTDSPDLPMARVQEAIQQCQPGRLVLGPDQGGGYYLLALSQPCPELFAGLQEGADSVFRATVRRAESLGLEVVTLAREADVDSYPDLLSLWARRATGPS